MSCTTATSPINISSKDYTDECSLKCQFKYNYARSPATTIKNAGNYLDFSYDKVKVNYNNTDLRVQDIRLYTPSLHTFDGQKADGELIIRHMDMGVSLLVCIPILISSNSSDASKTLAFLVSEAAKRTPNVGETAVVSANNFTLNNFIPKKKPFYAYEGTLPYNPCNGEHQYIVFMPTSSSVFLSSNTMATLKKIIVANDISIKPAPHYFLNKRGAMFTDPTSDEGDDDIYIECHPTGADGELIQVPLNGGPSKGSPVKFDNPIVIVLISVFGGLLLIWILSLALKLFRSRRAAGTSGAGTSGAGSSGAGTSGAGSSGAGSSGAGSSSDL